MTTLAGMMSDVDIREAIRKREMCITPFDPSNKKDKRLTPSGFNFSFSSFIVSLNHKIFYKIIEKNDVRYFFLEPGDTAIALTNESLWVNRDIAGTFHSKVTYVSQGMGHISTTLDPCWQGQLLISMNNPNRKRIRVEIARFMDGEWIYATFLTACFFRLNTATGTTHDNHPARLDTLYNIIKSAKKSKKQRSLTETVREMLKFSKEKSALRLSELPSVGESEIQKFIDDHKETLANWEERYKKIEHLNDRIVMVRKFWKAFGIFVGTIVVIISTILIVIKANNAATTSGDFAQLWAALIPMPLTIASIIIATLPFWRKEK